MGAVVFSSQITKLGIEAEERMKINEENCIADLAHQLRTLLTARAHEMPEEVRQRWFELAEALDLASHAIDDQPDPHRPENANDLPAYRQ